MSHPLFFPRLQKTCDGGLIPYPRDQQPTTLLHKYVLDAQDEFVISSLDAHAMNFRITAGKKINHITWKCTPDPNAFKFEFFPSVGRDRTMPTRFHEDQVQVCLNNKWIPMVDYLERESKRDELNPNNLPQFDAQLALKAQRSWWDANEKPFRLLDLPLELRTEIYRQAAPQDAIEPFARHPKRGILPKNILLPISDRNDMVSNLLRCGGVVGHEMREYMLKNLPLLINHQVLLHRTLRLNAWFPRHQLTHLALALPSHKHYVNLFGLNARNFVTDVEITIKGDEDTAVHLCRDHLPFIKKFEVVIPSREVFDHTYVDHCQTTATTLLLELMWPFIHGQPVVITGMIKNWQKKWWEAEFAQAHKDFDKIKADTEDGGSRVTQEDIDRAEGKADNNEYDKDGNCCDCLMECCLLHYKEPEPVFEYHLPFFCECDTPCLHGEWTPEDRIKDFEGDAVENSSIQKHVRQ